MKNYATRVLLSIALMFSVSAAYSDPVEYTFSTNARVTVSSELDGLTSVSGSFIYENGAVPILIVPGSETVYFAWSSISGSADGNSFSSRLGQAIVFNDTYLASLDFFYLQRTRARISMALLLRDWSCKAYFWARLKEQVAISIF